MKNLSILLFLFLVIIAGSCLTVKKAVRNVNLAADKYGDTVRQIFSSRWPVTERFSKGDSVGYKKYLNDIDSIGRYYDSLDQNRPETSSDTIIDVWEDSTKVLWYKIKLNSLNRTLKIRDKEIVDLVKKCKQAPAITDTVWMKETVEINKTITLMKVTSMLKKYWPWFLIIFPLVAGVVINFRRKNLLPVKSPQYNS